MPVIVMAANALQMDGSLIAPTARFLKKLDKDDTAPGLHIEPIVNSRDPRVRTGRVNDGDRAVLFKLTEPGRPVTYVFTGVWSHDDAIARAKQATLSINPVNGLLELVTPPADGHGLAERAVRTREALASEPEPVVPPVLVGNGYDHQQLVEGLGLGEHVAELALSAPDATDVRLLAEQVRSEGLVWQALALQDLINGYPIAEIKDRLQIAQSEPSTDAPVTEPAAVTDAELNRALAQPAARAQFAYIEDDAELARVIESGDFGAWRTFLHPEQRRYAEGSWNGPFRLSGGAGTGKTIVLVHRARALAAQNPQARILLTTYTKTLALALESSLRSLDPGIRIAQQLGDPGVHVASVDAAVNRVLRAASADERAAAVETVLGPRAGEVFGDTKDDAWRAVVTSAGLEAGLASAAFFQAEYGMVVLPNRVRTREEYVRVRRPGRGVALNRAKRDAVWKVIESYRASAAVEGTTDWAEKAAIAAALVTATGPAVDHVLVDEGQDLSPSQWQFLRGIAATGPNDLFIAEDSHQRIYGQPVVLGRYGISIVGRSRRLTLNYRTTAENLAYAIGVLSGAEYVDMEDSGEDTTQYRSARGGPRPRLLAASSLTDELDQAADVVRDWLGREPEIPPEAIGILVRDRNKAAQVVTGLGDRGVTVRHVEGRAVAAGAPVVMTMHRAKGMEFRAVLIFGVSDSELPAGYLARDLLEADRADFDKRERSLLYVSATRARDELVILWDGAPSSLLPQQVGESGPGGAG